MSDLSEDIDSMVYYEGLDPYAIKRDLRNLLDSLESGGTYAVSGIFDEAPLPGLSLAGSGPISLPLAERDSSILIQQRSELDKGMPTDVTEPTHHQWQFQSGQIAIENPAWSKFVHRLATRACQDLGIDTSSLVETQLVSTQLYGKGAQQEPYTVIEKPGRILARLSICLPSKHLGGETHLRYNNQTTISSSAAKSAFGYSYAAWYNGTTYEVKPILSGFKLTFEYNMLSNSAEAVASVESLYMHKDKLRSLLITWKVNVAEYKATGKEEYPTLLAHICDSDYRNHTLKFGVLQGDDRLRAECLKDICGQVGLSLYVAHLERQFSGHCNYYPSCYAIEEGDRSIKLTQLIDYDGNKVLLKGSYLNDTNIVQYLSEDDDPFDNDYPDEEDGDSQYGDVTLTHRRTVLVLIPDTAKSEWLSDGKEQTAKKRKRDAEGLILR